MREFFGGAAVLFRSSVREMASSRGSSVCLVYFSFLNYYSYEILFRNLSEAYLSVKLLKLVLPELVLVSVLGLALVCPVLSEGFPDISQWSSWSTKFNF